MNSGIPPGLEIRALYTLGAQCMLANGLRLPSPSQASSILHAHFTLKIAPVLALFPSRRDYRINSSPPGRAMGNPLSSLSLGISNQ